MLQARLFSYGDTQRYRLGVNFNHIPVNAPQCPFHSYHRDGAMRTDGNLGRTPTYFPNSRGEWIDQPQLNEPPLAIDGAAAHWDHRVDDDHYQQPGDLFRKMNAAQRQALFDNTARQLGGASQAHPGAPHRQLHQGRSGLRRRRCPGDPPARPEGSRGWSKDSLASLDRSQQMPGFRCGSRALCCGWASAAALRRDAGSPRRNDSEHGGEICAESFELRVCTLRDGDLALYRGAATGLPPILMVAGSQAWRCRSVSGRRPTCLTARRATSPCLLSERSACPRRNTSAAFNETPLLDTEAV